MQSVCCVSGNAIRAFLGASPRARVRSYFARTRRQFNGGYFSGIDFLLAEQSISDLHAIPDIMSVLCAKRLSFW